MSSLASTDWGGKNYSYQHVHGIMLVNLNKLGSLLNLSHSDYRIMGTLIGLWNLNKGIAFPTLDYLAKTCRMGKATIIRSLNRLEGLHLLKVDKTKGKRNNYHFSDLLFKTGDSSTIKPKSSSTCKTRHVYEQKRNLTNQDKTINFSFKKNTLNSISSQNTSILKEMISHKYWKHKPTGITYQVLPDIGTHLLIKINKNNTVTIFENNLTDKLENFEINLKQNLKPQTNIIKPDKKQMIKSLLDENKVIEAEQLAILFKMKSTYLKLIE